LRLLQQLARLPVDGLMVAASFHQRFVDQEGLPEYLSENVSSLSTFTNAQFGARYDCDFWDKIIVYQ
jgi:hypothetical protein